MSKRYSEYIIRLFIENENAKHKFLHRITTHSSHKMIGNQNGSKYRFPLIKLHTNPVIVTKKQLRFVERTLIASLLHKQHK